VLALLLVHPIRGKPDSGWVALYARWWFAALLPALVMLLLAVAKRIAQYGITEPRYFLLVLTLWLLALALYYVVSGSSNIRLIPVTLAILAVLTSLGPWGAYRVSRLSQARRFHAILAAKDSASLENRRELSAILRYLDEAHGPQAVAAVIGVPRDSVRVLQGDSTVDEAVSRRAMRRLGLSYLGRWDAQPSRDGTFWVNAAPAALDIAGYELARPLTWPGLGWLTTPRDSLELVADTTAETLTLRHQGAAVLTLALGAAMRETLNRDSVLSGVGRLPAALKAEAEAGGLRVRVLLESLGGRIRAGTLVLTSASGYLLVSGLLKP
jgi:hypothetical protein